VLRIGFLPSDFNPMVLMLGEAEDFRALAGVLRYFAREQMDTRLDRLGFCRPGGTPLTLMPAGGEPGITRDPGEAHAFRWQVDADLALIFADLVESLAHPARAAGSEFLAVGTDDEIPVKISRGEFTDDFLMDPPAAQTV
jgi:hypothetical protein